ncbi:MAG TPA: hypothetical protein VHF67_05775 [Gaiellaceae bacterium]|nr:hypothetical protein [Gaiellaceae bacterium]
MTNRSHTAHLPLLPADAVVEAPAREEAPSTRPDPDEATLMEEALEADADAVFRGFRLALAVALAFWAVLGVLLAWLL